MRHRYHQPIDPATREARRYHDPMDADDIDDCLENDAKDDSTAALKAAFWLLGVIALAFLLGLYLINRGR